MRKGTRRYVAWLCVFCMLLTSIPYSVLSDNAPATPTDLQPDAAEVTEEDGIRNIDAPAAEPAEQETENVYDDAHQIELHERTDTCYPVDNHQHQMDQTHYSDRK